MNRLRAKVILKDMQRNTKRSWEKEEALDLAIQALQKEQESIDKQDQILDNIGNKYVFHTEPTDEFTAGYNAAIRDVLSILKRGEI